MKSHVARALYMAKLAPNGDQLGAGRQLDAKYSVCTLCLLGPVRE